MSSLGTSTLSRLIKGPARQGNTGLPILARLCGSQEFENKGRQVGVQQMPQIVEMLAPWHKQDMVDGVQCVGS